MNHVDTHGMLWRSGGNDHALRQLCVRSGGTRDASDGCMARHAWKRTSPLSLVRRILARPARVPLPDFVSPQPATRVAAAPSGERWLHEAMLDGYRMTVRVERGRVRLLTRSHRDWTDRLPALARELSALHAKAALIDGELVVLDAEGRSQFSLLEDALASGREGSCVFYAFDLLHIDGRDLRALPLLDRKQRLEALIGRGSEHVRYTEHVVGNGSEVFARACAAGARGIVSKRIDALYQSQHTRAWLEVKCRSRRALAETRQFS
jgi:bifunctional non-homologous end joining protein LigD